MFNAYKTIGALQSQSRNTNVTLNATDNFLNWVNTTTEERGFDYNVSLVFSNCRLKKKFTNGEIPCDAIQLKIKMIVIE